MVEEAEFAGAHGLKVVHRLAVTHAVPLRDASVGALVVPGPLARFSLQ